MNCKKILTHPYCGSPLIFCSCTPGSKNLACACLWNGQWTLLVLHHSCNKFLKTKYQLKYLKISISEKKNSNWSFWKLDYVIFQKQLMDFTDIISDTISKNYINSKEHLKQMMSIPSLEEEVSQRTVRRTCTLIIMATFTSQRFRLRWIWSASLSVEI